MNNFRNSMVNKIKTSIPGRDISQVVYIVDDDGDIIDNVIYFRFNQKDTLGFFIDGPNPLISRQKIHEVDDFNLLAKYDSLSEKAIELHPPLLVEKINFYFHVNYNELLAINMSTADSSKSIFLIFLQDEIFLEFNLSARGVFNALRGKLTQFSESDFFDVEVNI